METAAVGLKECVQTAVATERVVAEVLKAQASARGNDDLLLAERCEETLKRLRATTLTKLDSATLAVVSRPDEFLVDEQVIQHHSLPPGTQPFCFDHDFRSY
jgi:hypothetical protein